jgi:hypothetical protein
MPKKQPACLLGASPENLSRIFAHMTREGLIRVQGNCSGPADKAERIKRAEEFKARYAK